MGVTINYYKYGIYVDNPTGTGFFIYERLGAGKLHIYTAGAPASLHPATVDTGAPEHDIWR